MPPKTGSPQRGGWPHTHPSLNCYKTHRCRCDGCKQLHNEDNRLHREQRKLRQAAGLPIRTRVSRPIGLRYPKPLPPEELVRLRRLVGFDPNKDYTTEDLVYTWKEKKRVKAYEKSLNNV